MLKLLERLVGRLVIRYWRWQSRRGKIHLVRPDFVDRDPDPTPPASMPPPRGKVSLAVDAAADSWRRCA